MSDVTMLATDGKGNYIKACTMVDPELMFPEERTETEYNLAQIAEAKAVCAGCFFRQECAQESIARGDEFGVFGGLTGKERAALVRRSQRARAKVQADEPLVGAL